MVTQKPKKRGRPTSKPCTCQDNKKNTQFYVNNVRIEVLEKFLRDIEEDHTHIQVFAPTLKSKVWTVISRGPKM